MDGFEVIGSRRLRRKGLVGTVRVTFGDDALVLRDAAGAAWVLPAARVELLRHGVERAMRGGPFHETRIRIAGEASLLTLTAIRPPPGAAQTLGDFAAAVERQGRAGCLQAGLGDRRHHWLGWVMALPLAFAVAVCLGPLREAPSWQWAAILAVPAVVAAIGLKLALRGRPRALRDAAAFRSEVAEGISAIFRPW